MANSTKPNSTLSPSGVIIVCFLGTSLYVLGAVLGSVLGIGLAIFGGFLLIGAMLCAFENAANAKAQKIEKQAQGFTTELARSYYNTLVSRGISNISSEENKGIDLRFAQNTPPFNIPNVEKLYIDMFRVGSGQGEIIDGYEVIASRKQAKADARYKETLRDKMVQLGTLTGRSYQEIVAACGKETSSEYFLFTDIGEGTRKTWKDSRSCVILNFDKDEICRGVPKAEGAYRDPQKKPTAQAHDEIPDGAVVAALALAVALFFGFNVIRGHLGAAGSTCWYSGCSRPVAGTQTAYCSTHSGHCLNCGTYVDPDAAFCIRCLTKR